MPKGFPSTNTMTTQTVVILKWLHKSALWGVYDIWCEYRGGYALDLVGSLQDFELYWLESLNRSKFLAEDIVKEKERQDAQLPRKVY
jgi:hypothetical protein